jgi:tRNA-splicing endonuclease subunit Sen54
MPTLYELTHMFSGLPRTPVPLPRKKSPTPSSPSSSPEKEQNMSFFRRLMSFTWLGSSADSKSTPKPQPFAAIRAGHKNVIIGVVDAGTVSFFRFGEGCFDEWPLI